MSDRGAPRHRRVAAILLVLAVALPAALYGCFLSNPLLFDDENLLPVLSAAASPILSPRFLSWWSFQLAGDSAGAAIEIHRLGNLLIHLVVVVLVYGLGHRLLTLGGLGERSRPLAAAAALLFAVHPAASFGVAYLIQRTILLSTLFALVTTWCHLQAQQRGDGRWWIGAVLAFAASVFSKEHSVALPGVLAVLSYWLHRQGCQWRWRWVWVFAAYLACALWITLTVRGSAALGALYEPQAQGFAGISEQSHLVSIATQLVLFHRYFATWLLPSMQTMSIDLQTDLPLYVVPWWGLAALVAYVGLAAWSLAQIHRQSRWALPALATLWLQILFVTEFWGVRFSEIFVLYRSYLWAVWIPLALLLALATLADKLFSDPAKQDRILVTALLILTAALSLKLYQRLEVFSDEAAVWREAVDRNRNLSWPGASRAPYQLGVVLAERGQYDQALKAFEEAVRRSPDHSRAHNNLGNVHYLRADIAAATAAWQRAVEADPGNPLPLYNLAIIARQQGREAEAASLLRRYEWLSRGQPSGR